MKLFRKKVVWHKTCIYNIMNKESGQTTVEYSVMIVLCVTIATVMIILLSALSDYGWRLLSLVGLDYP